MFKNYHQKSYGANIIHRGNVNWSAVRVVLKSYPDNDASQSKIDIVALVDKLVTSGLEKTYVKWIKNYLTRRTAFARLGAVQSEGVPITWGLQQGAVLSLLLLNIILSDLPVVDEVQLIIYADDITILSKGDSLIEVRACLKRYLDTLATWFKKWKLMVNPATCSQQIFTKKHSITDAMLRLNNSVVRNVTYQRVLGIVFDAPRLTFAAHIGNLAGDHHKRIQVLQALSAARWGASRLLLRQVHIAIIRSSSTLPTALYNEATTLGTDTLYQALPKSTSPQELALPEEIDLQPTAERKKQKPIILFAERMGSNNIRINKNYSNYTSRRSAGNTCTSKKQQLISYSNV
ncbi:Reverse transcriptase domain [Trinorchestia longiramus]|nr:Reverse transcriptase domain [Trinorchestia longiramus]